MRPAEEYAKTSWLSSNDGMRNVQDSICAKVVTRTPGVIGTEVRRYEGVLDLEDDQETEV